jgi:predicted dithiol-disulfide oxidoreductase (DUF899 family)
VRLKVRMGWEMPWYALTDAFDADFGVHLDVTPLGRQEVWEDSPKGYPQTPPYKWWNWHDAYAADAARGLAVGA